MGQVLRTKRAGLPGQVVGSLIAASFGAVYVVVNSASLPGAVQWTLRSLAGAAVVVVLVALAATEVREPAPYSGRQSDGAMFGPAYWIVVGIEVVAIFGGVRVMAGPLDMPEAGVAWVSLVVGTHFFALGKIFGQPFFHALGAAICLCGGAAMTLAWAGVAASAIDVVGGVAPGAILLISAYWGATRGAGPDAASAGANTQS